MKRPDKRGERRWARRYDVSLEMQIWPESEERGVTAQVVKTRDLSMCGIYFVSQAEPDIGARLNFSVIFIGKATGEQRDLMRGLARIVRSEPLKSAGAEGFGIGMAIERMTDLPEG